MICNVPTNIIEALETALADALFAVAEDDAYWARLATGQDTEEAEASGVLAGYADGLRDALRIIRANRHPKVPYGRCPVCRHYGEDCTGREA